MQQLLQILQISNYRPSGGYDLDLIELVRTGLDQDGIIQAWKGKGRSVESLYKIHSSLRHKLLSDTFVKSELSDLQVRRINAWERFEQIKRLLVGGKKAIAMDRAVDAIAIAQRCDLTVMVANLAHHLEYYFGAVKDDTRRYLRYRKIRKEYQQRLVDEMEVQALLAQLVHFVNRRKNWRSLESEILATEGKEGSTLYVLQRHVLLSVWYELSSDFSAVLEIFRKTRAYFEKSKHVLPFTTSTELCQRAVPMMIAIGHNSEAERELTKVLSITPKYGHYWHLMMSNRALLGLWSGKPAMTSDAIRKASRTSAKQNELLTERWHIIRAYLALSEPSKPFRIGKFLNSVTKSAQDKQGTNVAIIIVELLHYLFRDQGKKYMQRANGIEDYCKKHLRGKENARARAMLQLLYCVEDGDRYRTRVELRAKKWLKLLKDNPARTVKDYEVIPFERVWEMIRGRFR